MIRRAARWLLLSLAAALIVALPFGPLFPWSPWKPGYERISSARADVYHAPGRALPPAYRDVDRIIADAEDYLAVKTRRRIRVVVCPDWGAFRRYVPWMGGRGVGGVTLVTGTAIYITPRLDERGLNHEEFLRHEILHAVAHQRQPLWRARAYSRIEWISEGTAVSFGRQKSYEPAARVVEFARSAPVAALLDPYTQPAARDMRLAYPVWRYFNEYLQSSSGSAQHRFYVRSCVRDPSAWRTLFPVYFGAEFPAKAAEFDAALRSGAWRPAE